MAVVIVLCCTTVAQEAARSDRGTALNRNYAISDIENINLQNGNLQLSIGLAGLPPIAGGKLAWTVGANYNSKIFDVLRFQQEAPDLEWTPYVVDMPAINGGWSLGSQYGIQFRNANDDFYRVWYTENSGLPQWELDLLNDHQWWKVVLVMPDGAEHELRPLNYGSYWGSQDFLRGYFNVLPSGSPLRYYSIDGSYLFATISSTYDWTVHMPDGTRIIQTPNGIQRIQDTNGNKVKIFADANGTHYQDEQTGREIRITYDAAANGGQGQYRVWYPTVGGTQHYIDINLGTTTVQGKTYPVNDFDYTGVCQRTEGLYAQLQVVREIIFPQTEPGQQRKFVFSYNSDTTENTTTSVNWTCNGGYENYTRAASVGWGEISRVISPPGTIQTAAYSDYSYTLTSEHSLAWSADDLAKQSIGAKELYHDGTVDTWSYSISESFSSFTSPDGSWFSEARYCSTFGTPGCSTDKAGLAYRTTRPFVRTERHWINLVFSGADVIKPGGVVSFNPVVDYEYTTLLDANNNPLKMSAKAFQYDYNGNVTQTKEYDWFDHNLVSRDAQGVPTGIPGSATLLRTVNHSHYNQAVGSTSANVYAKRSASTGAPLILNAPQQTTVGPSIVQLSYDGQAYGTAPTLGNLTSKRVWVDLDSKWITTSSTYGLYGNIATSTDGRGKVIQYFFDDATHALPNRVVVDPQNGTGTQTTTTAYDYWTGLVISATDPNGAVSTIDYTNQVLGMIDPFGRPGVRLGPVVNVGGVNQRHRTTTTYLDSARQVIVASDLNNENDKLLKTRTTADMLGRPVLVEGTEDGTNYTIFSNTVYQQMGKITFTSNPRRAAAAGNEGWTRATKDIAGRVTEVATFYGATQPPSTGTNANWTGNVTTAYEAEFTTVTDQAGKLRRSKTDALGRLVRVDEPNASNSLGATTNPTQPSNYTYDVFDNLRTVTQGAQTRTFTYDSVSRLRSAANPESGTITYSYDDNGNLTQKTDARNITTTYAYDALNRNTTVNYSNTTVNPDIVRFYDNSINYGKGRFWYDYFYKDDGTIEHQAVDGYDSLGRTWVRRQVFYSGGQWHHYETRRTYNLAGSVVSQQYPSGRTVTYNYDAAGRTSSFSGTLGDGANRTYASNTTYTAGGQMQEERFGTTTPLYHKLRYNSRGQLYDIRLSTVAWATDPLNWNRGCLAFYHDSGYHWGGLPGIDTGPDNNGNVLRAQYYRPGDDQITTFSATEQNYTYDELNRLTSVMEYYQTGQGYTQQFTQAYLYDRWGNRSINTGATWGTGINNKAFTVNTTNNRLGVPGGQSGTMSYDSAGNLITDTYTGAGSRVYDAENRMTQAWGGNNQWQYYTYNSDGQRTRRKIDNQETWQVYGFDGELLAEYAPNTTPNVPKKEYGYRNGQLLVTTDGITNLALNKPASQSSTAWDAPAQRGVDGNTDGNFWNGSVTHTAEQTEPWWQVDLQSVATIQNINVWNRTDCCGEALSNFYVFVSDNPFTANDVASTQNQPGVSTYYVAGQGGVPSTIAVNRTGRYVRVQLSGYERLSVAEVQVLAGGGAAEVRWLVSDHLGTPRMIIDKTGSLANVKRHDYLPFGEELFAGVGSRTTQQGYAGGDGVRQQFTQKERDNETNLDYFLARYYSSTQGRFTSVDPSRKSIVTANPQTWNRYVYALNNPGIHIDPDGKWPRPIHNLIIDRAFAGLSTYERAKIKEGQWSVDNPVTGGQKTSRSNEHGMTIPGQTPEEAAEKADTFINNNVDQAQATKAGSNLPMSLYYFGRALHTVQDMTSPAHEGYQVWRWRTVFLHRDTESMISSFRMGLAVGASLSLYRYTYGQAALESATGYTPGSNDDPTVREIQSRSALPGSSPLAEAYALYEYGLGLREGLQFDWSRQRGRRGRRQSERPIAPSLP